MRKAPFAFMLLALFCGWTLAARAADPPADIDAADEPAGSFRLTDEASLAQSLGPTPNTPSPLNRPDDPLAPGSATSTAAPLDSAGAVSEPWWQTANRSLFQIPDDGSWLSPAPPHWYFQADVLFLHRGRAHDQVMVVNDAAGQAPVLSTHDVDFNNSPKAGPMFTLGYQIDPESSFEVTYFGLNNWSSSAYASGPGNLSIPGPLALQTIDYFLANSVNLTYNSNINNAELNYKQTINHLTLLGGFRYFEMNEQFNMQVTNTSYGLSDVSNYNVKTNNNLLGGQLGIGWKNNFGRLETDVLGKAGLYSNLSYSDQVMGDLNNSILLRDYTDKAAMLAFLGEVQANATYRINSWLAIRGGYRIMWLDGMVLAPNQVNFGATPGSGSQIQNRSSLIMHGFNCGAEIRW